MPQVPPREGARLRQQQLMGQKFKSVRVAAGIKQTEASDPFGRSRQWLTNVENGLNGLDAIDAQALADFYGYPLSYFVDPKYDVRKPQYPKSLNEWRLLCGGDSDLAERHYRIARGEWCN